MRAFNKITINLTKQIYEKLITIPTQYDILKGTKSYLILKIGEMDHISSTSPL